jgi:hypothetical protein
LCYNFSPAPLLQPLSEHLNRRRLTAVVRDKPLPNVREFRLIRL